MSTFGRSVIFIFVSLLVLGIVWSFFKFLLKWAIIAIVLVGIIRFVIPELSSKK